MWPLSCGNQGCVVQWWRLAFTGSSGHERTAPLAPRAITNASSPRRRKKQLCARKTRWLGGGDTASAAKSKPLLAHERPAGQTYTEAQANKKRPLSPHVTIYAFPASAISSITNRVTGVGLAVGCYGIGAMSFFGGDPAALMQTLGQSGVAPLFKFGEQVAARYGCQAVV